MAVVDQLLSVRQVKERLARTVGVEYDGLSLSGWQTQRDLPTVQDSERDPKRRERIAPGRGASG